MTAEQREIKRAKDREYYQKKKAKKKVTKVSDMTEREKRKLRKRWRKASKTYREKKMIFANAISNTPPTSEDESTPRSLTPENAIRHNLARREVGRKIVRKDRAKAYRTIQKKENMITQMRRTIESLKKKLQRNTQKEKKISSSVLSPKSKVNELVKDINVPPEVRKRLLFAEVLTTQLKDKADSLPKNSKDREVFQKCVSGTTVRKYRLLHMAKTFMPKEKNDKPILKTDVKDREVVLKPDLRQKVKDFFEKDDISRMCPGKRDYVKKNGVKKQKRVLLDSVKALQPKFFQETGINLPYTTLLRAKPFWIVAPKSRDRETCLCVKHENFELKLSKLNSLQQTSHRSAEEIVKEYSCDMTSYECMTGLCDKCKKLTLQQGDNEETVTYFQWQSINEKKLIKGENKTFKITKKVPVTSTIKHLRKALAEEIPIMKQHLYGIYNYNKQKKELKENITENEIMIQIDFSENYTTKYAKEIQSSHFVKNQLTIHTGVHHSRNIDSSLQTTAFATVSENLDHQAHAVWAHLKPILRQILENPKIDTLHIYSDGPTSQYRNRTNIFLWLKTLIDEFEQVTNSTWTFSEPGHGKGPMDGVGGVLKRTADRHVLMGKDIKSGSDFVGLFTESSILVKEVSDKEVTEMKETIPKAIDAIPGIMKITNIKWKKGPKVCLELFQYKHLQKRVNLQDIRPDNDVLLENELFHLEEPPIDPLHLEEPTEANYYKDLVNNNKKQSIFKAIYGSSSSDDEDLMTISNRKRAEQNIINAEAGTSYGAEKENIHPNLISPGTYLLINVPTQKQGVFYRYVGVSQTYVEDDGEVKITFLKSVRNSAKVFKLDPKDISYIAYEQIKEIVPVPTIKKEKCRQYYYFKSDVDIFEKD